MTPKVTPALPPNWKMIMDPRSGRPYYANTVTGKSQWETPQVANKPTQDEFIKMYDTKSKRYYWANMKTGKTQWNDPKVSRENTAGSQSKYASTGGQKSYMPDRGIM